MEIAKAIVLAGDTPGGPPWPSLRSVPQPLVPVANRPILFHTLDTLSAAGVLETTIAVEPATAAPIRAAIGDGSDWRMVVRYAECPARMTLDDALAATTDFAAREPILVHRVDSLLKERMHTHIAAFAGEGLDALALRLPGQPDITGAGVDSSWLLSQHAVAILARSATRPDPVTRVRAGGGQVRIQEVDGCLPCAGGHDTLLEANRRMLEGLVPSVPPGTVEDSRLQGAVAIDPTATVLRSVIRGPVVIGPGARVVDSYVGPSTSIGAEAVIEGAQVEYSILMPRSEVRFVGVRLEESVVGYGARVHRSFSTPGNALRLAIGDGADVGLG
jgi:glucose-1-phosphate thymidylyltransferase